MRSILLALAIFPIPSLFSEEPSSTIPSYRIEETIVSYRGTGTMDYLGFPAIAPSGENEIMLSYKIESWKWARDHGWDPGAVLENGWASLMAGAGYLFDSVIGQRLRFDLKSGRAIQAPIQLGVIPR